MDEVLIFICEDEKGMYFCASFKGHLLYSL